MEKQHSKKSWRVFIESVARNSWTGGKDVSAGMRTNDAQLSLSWRLTPSIAAILSAILKLVAEFLFE
jgi:hypothetical protein